MAINPIRTAPPDYPANPNVAPLNFDLGLGALGSQIGAYRDRQESARLLQDAIDPQTGELNLNKAAAIYAAAGRDPTELFTGAIRQQTLRATEAHQRAMEEFARQNAESARIGAERPQYSVQPPSEGDIMTPARPGVIIELPRRPGEPPKSYPYPTVAPPPVTPPAVTLAPATGKQSAIEPDIESAPPYRVAGPPQPPPQQPAATAAAPAASPFNEPYLASLPTDAARTLVKGVANYEIDPQSLDAKLRSQILIAAKNYRPDYNAADFEKRGTVSPEMRARIGIARSFLDSLNDRTEGGYTIPGIKSRIAAGELQGQGRIAANFGQGTPGELRAAIDEGAESLIRMLTGAGMNQQEATDYARRFRWSPIDDVVGQGTAMRKVDALEKVLRYVGKEVEGGTKGEKFLEGFKSQFGKDVAVKQVANEAEANKRIGQGRAAIKANPAARDEVLRMWRQMGISNAERYLP